MRGAVDQRLFRYARASRRFLLCLIGLGVLAASLIIAQAWLLAQIITQALSSGRSIRQLSVPFGLLLFVIVARATVAWGRELLAHHSSAVIKAQMRTALLEHVGALGTAAISEQRTGEIAVLATQGIDALEGYFSRYLPQIVLAVIVPMTVLVSIAGQDWISALIIAGTLPLIPLFMALVGAETRTRVERQFRTLEALAGHFLDVVNGLPTLKVFGRAKAQIVTIGEVTHRYREATMSTLRVTFLSSLILELVATISVALVAVEIGLRLMGGHLGLRTALIVLVLAPEAYLPLRALGANYHAGTEGLTAAARVFGVLDTAVPTHGRRRDVPDPARQPIVVENITVRYPNRGQAALDGVSVTISPGEVLAITGPSGCGKSTLLAVLLGFVAADSGSVTVGGVELSELDPDTWRAQLAWVPQRPHLLAASIADNIRLGRPGATDGQVSAAVAAAGLETAVAGKPAGLETVLGDHGAGLSVGERQRVALARAFLRAAPLLVLDEPTASLDAETEEELLLALEQLVAGRTVILVAHRPALVGLADRVLDLGRVRVPA
jgi:thiol reductant ABC exporter CydD subunit